ncbi:MFS transporter [Bartonella sp. HY406]|uniref:MFS transporter n=1 Tax=Bartonella sp. HY406 TaxID=2979331 RepID=UPI0021C889EA|nr:MFS transporter [Bartonella sp. HY406]UXN05005.1 MHS family MFS transporter [Bartonella sp. HY406]
MTAPTRSEVMNKRVLAASLIGSAIEWFDYFLYATMAALVFNKLFFPEFDPIVGQMLAYLTFSLTFFVRPLGGFIFSHIGDKIGRKKTLVLTLSLMGISTFGIGILPTYDQIGVWAAVLLIVLRLIQGLGISGEWGGALLLAFEYAPSNRKGLFGSVPQLGVPLGLVLATGALSLVSLLPQEQFMSWGWRLPFIGSILLVFVGLWIRKGVDETPAFRETQKAGKIASVPIVDTFRDHWREVLIATGAKVVETAPFYLFTTFIISYATNQLNIEKFYAINSVTVASIVTILFIPLMGLMSDIFGRKKVFLFGCVLMAAFAFPYFMILDTRTITGVFAATIIGAGIVWAPLTATLGTLMSEIFSARVRYTGITLGYQIGAAFAGGTAPFIATMLLYKFNGAWFAVAFYIIFCAIISFVSVMFARPIKDPHHTEIKEIIK